MGRRQLTIQEIEDLRDRICDAAADLLSEKGMEALTIRAIAQKAGCSPMTPYQYFPDGKHEILGTLRARALSKLADAMEAAGRVQTPKAIDQVTIMGEAYVNFALENEAEYRLTFEAEPLPEDQFPEIAVQVRRLSLPVRDIFTRAIEEGTLRGEPLELAQLLWAGLHGLVSLQLAGQLRFGKDIHEMLVLLTNTLNPKR